MGPKASTKLMSVTGAVGLFTKHHCEFADLFPDMPDLVGRNIEL
jgi:hypothetical protein